MVGSCWSLEVVSCDGGGADVRNLNIVVRNWMLPDDSMTLAYQSTLGIRMGCTNWLYSPA